jgi:hypothetical protein
VRLTASGQIDRAERSINCEKQSRNVNVGKVDIYFLGTMRSASHAAVHDRKLEGRGKRAVYTALTCASIYECVNYVGGQVWHARWDRAPIEIGVETD